MKGRALRNFLAGIGSLAYFLQGYTQSVLNGLVTLDTFVRYFPSIDTVNATDEVLKTHATMQGTVVAVYEAGGAFGGLLCFLLAHTLGRKRTVFWATVFQLIGGILQTSAFSTSQLIVGRIATGIGMGAYCATIPLWICECIGPAHRGKTVLLLGCFGDIGMVVANWVTYAFFYAGKTDLKWRIPLSLQLPGAVAILLLVFYLPESPRWLSARGKQAKALEVFAALSGRKGKDPTDPEVQDELDTTMKDATESAKSHRLYFRIFLAVFINMMGCLTGISVLTFFSTEVLETQMSFSADEARLVSAGLELVRAAFAFVSMALVDKLGRRPLMLCGAAGMMVSMAAMAILTKSGASQGMLYGAIVFQFMCMVFYPIGFHLMPTMYAAEIAPAKYRHKVTAASNGIHWLFNFMIAEVSPLAFNSLGNYYYIVYACTNAVTLVVVYFVFLETKDLTLEEIESVFSHLTSYLKIQQVRT
ncbi:Sugar transporter STL1 [Wickerhamiella sorbophila]|uniref:Sugar transporter STL1 n=1 Tax=Wickerhamiella sorbophila TaxID=45607 RepID=A0A2T0FFN6_9ASCO|nr:Sugar transporter STL1 [Wickerhamiella sorbophila]PRT53806.1 Sugar transporter STL1 [Wickerhamiella sorbophila]